MRSGRSPVHPLAPRWPAYQLINIKQNFKHVWMKVLAYWKVVRTAEFRLKTHQM